MNKKPIRRDKNLLKLSKEHHASLLFCWKIRQGVKMDVSPARMINYIKYFQANFLFPHFREEETCVFPALADRQVEKAIQQHRAIENIIEGLLNKIPGDLKKQLTTLADLTDEHVRYEERELFPHIEKTLPVEQLDEIGALLSAADLPAMKDEFEDEFWIIK